MTENSYTCLVIRIAYLLITSFFPKTLLHHKMTQMLVITQSTHSLFNIFVIFPLRMVPCSCIRVFQEWPDSVDYFDPREKTHAGSISMDYFQAYIYSSAIDNLSLPRRA